ncbi:MAG: hypothetical protein P8Y72_15035 [Anaerolineales bacterium]|jgi:hypothetical protein
MFPNNPNLLEAYVWTNVDEIQNQAKKDQILSTKKLTIKTLVIPSIVIALAVLLLIVL